MTRIMNVVMSAALLLMGMASGAYAAREFTVEEDFQQGPGSTDEYVFFCGDPGKMTMKVKDKGPAKDIVMSVEATCNNTGEEQSSTAKRPGDTAKVTVDDCTDATFKVTCDEGSCNGENYIAQFFCRGDFLGFAQTADE